MESARILDLIISLHYFKNQTPEEEDIGLFEQLMCETSGMDVVMAGERSIKLGVDKQYSLGIIYVRVHNIEDLELFKSIVAAQSKIMEVSIYYDEYEKLIAKIPESLQSECEMYLSDFDKNVIS